MKFRDQINKRCYKGPHTLDDIGYLVEEMMDLCGFSNLDEKYMFMVSCKIKDGADFKLKHGKAFSVIKDKMQIPDLSEWNDVCDEFYLYMGFVEPENVNWPF